MFLHKLSIYFNTEVGYIKLTLFTFSFSSDNITAFVGGVAEWSNAPHLKCGVSQGTVSSNLTPTALRLALLAQCFQPHSANWRIFPW